MTDKRVALVTGATSGTGIVIAQQLVDRGFSVVISGRNEARGQEVREQLGEKASFMAADVSAPGTAADLVQHAVATFGQLDVVVNNAAIDHTVPLLDVGEDEIRKVLETNTLGAMNLLIEGARRMRDQGRGGSIINITSRLASIGVPTMGVYSASKGAMLAFTRSSAIDLAPHNIRVNAVAPGMIRTPLYEAWLGRIDNAEEEAAKVAAAIPLGRIAEPEDVAAVVSFLASPEAAYLTGVSIPVDGGYLAK